MRKFTYNGDYPNPTEAVFVCYNGEPKVGYYSPFINEDPWSGGHFVFDDDTETALSDEIDYWIQP